ncbi:acyl-CoA thioester hydrolase [Arenibacter nanhaiticus]|uniref:Acyl-CoA thioester hydrolase n=1 Tax=Arenibacter nanhaiticus TaxID=558155 RepID=A0A1M6D350_9FLAO|nr:acyl-CoA thioesterase [Arenibacter nanhaiticus]SHI67670.1 acyl-CoA thioester hydrolase [Arenibacter nanhaiticus]
MYLKDFEIRWSDVDANRHMANSAYLNFMSHTRMAFLLELGFDQKTMARHNLGPVVFHEHMYYFREAFLGKPVKVSLELMGLSEDGMFFEFHHDFYDDKGVNFAHCEVMGAWIDLKTRNLTPLENNFLEAFNKVPKAEGFKALTREDTRKFGRRPKELV